MYGDAFWKIRWCSLDCVHSASLISLHRNPTLQREPLSFVPSSSSLLIKWVLLGTSRIHSKLSSVGSCEENEELLLKMYIFSLCGQVFASQKIVLEEKEQLSSCQLVADLIPTAKAWCSVYPKQHQHVLRSPWDQIERNKKTKPTKMAKQLPLMANSNDYIC